MKKFIQTVSFLGLTLIFGAAAANAQANVTRVDADIPFDFMVGKERFEAGKYVLRISTTAGGAKAVSILNERREQVASTFATENGDRAKTSAELRFDKSAGTAVLSQIITENGGYSVASLGKAAQIASTRKAAKQTQTN